MCTKSNKIASIGIVIASNMINLQKETAESSRCGNHLTTVNILTCTLAKSTLLRSANIWLICEVFCRTARAACAR